MKQRFESLPVLTPRNSVRPLEDTNSSSSTPAATGPRASHHPRTRKDSDEDDPDSEGKTITGWVLEQALVGMNTPNGDKIIFGEASI